WSRVDSILAGYAERWTAMHRDACQATRIRGEQSEQLMDKRMACLDVRSRELAKLTALLRHPDATVVQNAAQAARGLGSIDGCGDLVALTRPIAEPADPATAAQVAAARLTLADVSVLNTAGKFDDGLALAQKLAAEKAARDYLPLRAEVSYWTHVLYAS